jgi:transposase InsO family protein
VARIAAAALEDALRDRRIAYGHTPLTLRSDNGLVFGAKVFVDVATWLEKYHTERPHSALGYLTPKEFAERLAA